MATTQSSIEPVGLDAAATALERAVAALFAAQHPDGWWKGELETNVTMDAEDLFLREFLGIGDAAITAAAANWIRSKQRDDGTWATSTAGRPTCRRPSRRTGRSSSPAIRPTPTHMRRGGAVRRRCGRPRAQSRSSRASGWRCSACGRGTDLPALPPEMILLPPPGRPLNIYDFACWARQTIVPLTVVGAYRPARPMLVTLDELRTGVDAHGGRAPTAADRPVDASSASTACCTGYERRPIGCAAPRRVPAPNGGSSIARRPTAAGAASSRRGCTRMHRPAPARLPPRPSGHAGRAGRSRRGSPSGSPTATVRRLEACQSPVWDTALAVGGAGRRRRRADRRPSRTRGPAGCSTRRSARPATGRCGARTWRRAAGPSSSRTTTTPTSTTPPRWSWRSTGSGRSSRHRVRRVRRPRAVRWTAACSVARAADGARSTSTTPARCRTQLPFCDFGAVIDPPIADVTAHVIEMLGQLVHAGRGEVVDPRVLDRAAQWLSARAGGRRLVVRALGRQPPLRHRRRGAGAGRRGRVHRGSPCRASACAGSMPCRTTTAAGARTCARTPIRPGAVAATSTASQTAWALLALLAARELDEPTRRGVAWLVETPASRRLVGRAVLHRHRVPRRLLHQLPPVPAWCSRSWRSAGTSGRWKEEATMDETGLYVLAPLRLEATAAQRGAATARIKRTGMGRRRSLSRGAPSRCHVGRYRSGVRRRLVWRLRSDLQPGDIVVASEVRSHSGDVRIALPGAPLLAGSLADAGLPVRFGPLVSTERIVTGSPRQALAASGALAVDMESAWLVAGLHEGEPRRPFAVVRVVLDTPDRRAALAAHPAQHPAGPSPPVQRRPRARAVGRGHTTAARAARCAAIVLRRGRASDRDRRSRPRPLRAARVRPAPDRAQHPCGRSTRTPRCDLRAGARRGASRFGDGVRRPRRVTRGARRRRAPAAHSDRRDLPVGRQGAHRGAAVRRPRVRHRARRPRRSRGGRGHGRRGARPHHRRRLARRRRPLRAGRSGPCRVHHADDTGRRRDRRDRHASPTTLPVAGRAASARTSATPPRTGRRLSPRSRPKSI